MKKIVLIACGKRKAKVKTKAKNMYIGSYFNLILQYARSLKPDEIFILSAKYGLLELEDEIEPYDKTLKTASVNQLKKWTINTLDQMKRKVDLQNDNFVILAGKAYRRFLTTRLKKYSTPLEGLRMGKQIEFINKEMRKNG